MDQAADWARQRLSESHPAHLEACGYELHRLYNMLEKAFERVTDTFGNHFDKRGDYHERLIQRLSLDIPGVRPTFFPVPERANVRELKSFRHIFRHAYDLQLRSDRLAELKKCKLKESDLLRLSKGTCGRLKLRRACARKPW